MLTQVNESAVMVTWTRLNLIYRAMNSTNLMQNTKTYTVQHLVDSKIVKIIDDYRIDKYTNIII